MTGQIIKTNRWWNGVERTKDGATSAPLTVPEPTFEQLAEHIRRATNDVVNCQCELAKAQHYLEDCHQVMRDKIADLDKELKFLESPLK